MNNFFNNCTCLEEVKATYRELALKNHPDLGGDSETMKAINNAYEVAFLKFKNVYKSAKGETYNGAETAETPQEFMNIINQLINCNGLEIELIGRWIWVSGETKKHKETLKALGFRWSANKKLWSWHFPEDRKLSRKSFNIDDIRTMFGSSTFEANKLKAIAE